MNDPYAHRRLRLITTWARLPDGRIRTSWNSYPLGVGKDVYDAIDAALVRAYGNNNCRTEGVFLDDPAETLASGQTRSPRATPTPCIACGRVLESAADDAAFDHVPYAGTLFTTGGHYGSTAFDSFDGHRLVIVACDDCLRAHASTRVRLVRPDGTMEPWDGETDGWDPNSPQGKAQMVKVLELFTGADTGIGEAHPGMGPTHDEFVAGLPDGLPDRTD